MARVTVLCVVGTRPEAIKLAPVILALRGHPRLRPVVAATAQHRALLDRALADFGIVPDIDLDLMQPCQRPIDLFAAALPLLADVIETLKPATVVVQGDTVTALAASHAAVLARVPLAHVEAGLRSGDRAAPFPEEDNRRVIAQLAGLHFAPTAVARAALLAENVPAADIHVTGNTGIDALRLIEARLDGELRAGVAAALPGLNHVRPLALVTVHRRENHGAPLIAIVDAVARLADDGVEVVWPVHPHPAVHEVVHRRLDNHGGVHLLPALGYPAFVALMRRAALILTDSGGVQEEAPVLGTPVLVMRNTTERGEGVASGNARLIGTSKLEIVDAVRCLLADKAALARMSEAAMPYGIGDAAARVVSVLDARFALADATGPVQRSEQA